MTASEPEVSWKAIERDAKVVTSDGAEAATVAEVAGDPDADIFNGLVLQVGTLGPKRYLPAERVGAIRPQRVEVRATEAELEDLPPYEEPRAERILPHGGGFIERLRRYLGRR